MDYREFVEFAKENVFTVIIGGTVISAIGLYLFLFRPLLGKIEKGRQEYTKIEADIFRSRAIIQSAKKIESKRTLLTEKHSDILQPINELSKREKLKGINFVSVCRKDEEKEKGRKKKGKKGRKKKGPYKILPIEMIIESTYEQAGIFFEELDNLDQGVVSIASFTIIPFQENPVQLKTVLVLDMYLYIPAVKFVLPEKLIPAKRKIKKTSYSRWGISPFIPPKKTKLLKTAPKLNLTLIFLHKDKPKAVINGKMVGIGDKIENIRVVDIKVNKVILDDGIKKFELSLGK